MGMAVDQLFRHAVHTLEVEGDGPADFFWADAAGLRERAVPSAFARYYAEAMTELEDVWNESN